MTKKIHGRHGSRFAALQGLYAWQFSGDSLIRIEEDLCEGIFHSQISFDKAFLHELLHTISQQKTELDVLMEPHLNRSLQDVHPIERAILWIAVYELKARLETPYKVIINEAILLAKQFGALDSHKFINGALDQVARKLREKELLCKDYVVTADDFSASEGI